MMVSNRNLLFQGAIFRFHVKLWEGNGITRTPGHNLKAELVFVPVQLPEVCKTSRVFPNNHGRMEVKKFGLSASVS